MICRKITAFISEKTCLAVIAERNDKLTYGSQTYLAVRDYVFYINDETYYKYVRFYWYIYMNFEEESK
jgi:hypothetical protein